MDETPQFESLRDRLRVLRRFRLLIAGVAVLVMAIALTLSLRQDDRFAATAQLSFQDVNQDVGIVGNIIQQVTAPAVLAAASAATIERPEVIEQVRAELRTTLTPAEIRDSVEATADPRSNLVLVEAEGDTAEFAAELANTVATVARDEANIQARNRFAIAARNLRRSERNLTPVEQSALTIEATRIRALARFATPAQIAAPAEVPDFPFSPKPIRSAIFGLVFGLLIGLALAYFLNSLDRRMRSSHEVQAALGIPLLGHVRKEAMGRTAVTADDDEAARDLEAFRILRTNLDYLDVDLPLRSVAVTSSLSEEGKSTVAASLAVASASMGKRTLLVDCDLRRPVVAKRLGLKESPGLTDYLVGQAAPHEILQSVEVAAGGPAAATGEAGGPQQLVCIAAGTANARASDLLSSERFRAFLADVTEAYDLVVVDTPPLLTVADTRTLAPLVDRVLFCVRAAQTTRDQALSGKAALEHLGVESIGLVVTGERAREESEYGYYQAYEYRPAAT